MKVLKFLVIAIAIVSITACSKKDDKKENTLELVQATDGKFTVGEIKLNDKDLTESKGEVTFVKADAAKMAMAIKYNLVIKDLSYKNIKTPLDVSFSGNLTEDANNKGVFEIKFDEQVLPEVTADFKVTIDINEGTAGLLGISKGPLVINVPTGKLTHSTTIKPLDPKKVKYLGKDYDGVIYKKDGKTVLEFGVEIILKQTSTLTASDIPLLLAGIENADTRVKITAIVTYVDGSDSDAVQDGLKKAKRNTVINAIKNVIRIREVSSIYIIKAEK